MKDKRMTRKEAIEILEHIRPSVKIGDEQGKRIIKAFTMAIYALENNIPCTNCRNKGDDSVCEICPAMPFTNGESE